MVSKGLFSAYVQKYFLIKSEQYKTLFLGYILALNKLLCPFICGLIVQLESQWMFPIQPKKPWLNNYMSDMLPVSVHLMPPNNRGPAASLQFLKLKDNTNSWYQFTNIRCRRISLLNFSGETQEQIA